jgi:amino acid permease
MEDRNLYGAILSLSSQVEMKRSLKTRHLTMIALGGSIGTGLFLTRGKAIAESGPDSLFFPMSSSVSWSFFS